MKKNLLIASSLVLFTGSVFLNGCKKDDTTAPVITISSDNPSTVILGGTYSDAGATATDAEDGTVTVSSSGTVDTHTAGTYTITYSASDKAGNNQTASRTVYVTIERSNYIMSFNADDSCTTNVTIGAFTWSGAIAAGGAANAIVFSGFSGTGASCTATVNGSVITIPSQTVGAFTNVNGNGTMNSTGTKITLDYSATMTGTTESYHAVLTKL